VDLTGFGWSRDTVTYRGCEWPRCHARATVHGSNGTEHVYLCATHGADVLDDLSAPARAKYDLTRQALSALGIETECRTIGEWLCQSVE
jgi:hypothetical protein